MNRVVIVGPAYPLRGGIAHFNESLAERLMERGIQTEIVSFYLQYPSVFFPGKTQKETADRQLEVPIHPLLSSVNPRSWAKAARYIAALQPDVVVMRFWQPFLAPALARTAARLRKLGILVVGLVDNAVPHEKRLFDEPLAKYFFERCDAFIALSQAVADDLGRMAPGKRVLVHPHPVYDIFGDPVTKTEAALRTGLSSDNQYVMFFGFIRRYKGLDLLLEAFAKDDVRKLGVKLLVAGEFYEDKQEYIRLIERLGLESSVIIHDHYIPTAQVAHYFAMASIVAQTYRSATQSGVTQIAYQFGRPMLVTHVGGLPEIVPDGEVGYVVPPRPEAIAAALARFFQEGHETKFAKAAEARKHLFSWAHFTDAFVDYLNEINEEASALPAP